MNGYVEVLLRSLIAVGFLFLVARLSGARQISQLTFFDYVTGITIGSIGGTLCVDTEVPIWYSIIAIAIFAFFTILVSWITSKSIVLRRIMTGKAHILVEQGKIIEKNLKKVRFDVNDLLREMRSQGYFNIAEIEYAILETNGMVSIMPIAAAAPLTTQDMQINAEQKSIMANVIIDGKIMEENLDILGKDVSWLEGKLHENSIPMEKIKDILVAVTDGDMTFTVYYKGEQTLNDTLFQ